MQTCSVCGSERLPASLFCHHCGAADQPEPPAPEPTPEPEPVVVETTLTCPNCRTENPLDARYCAACGYKLFERSQSPDAGREVTPVEPPELEPLPTLADLQERFRREFEERVREVGGKLRAFQQRAVDSDFLETAENRFEQLLLEGSRRTAADRRRHLDRSFADLLDYFFVETAADLAAVTPPAAALTYQDTPLRADNFKKIIQEFLQLDQEKEQHFTDLVRIPEQKLRNARRAFFEVAAEERPLLLFDNSLTGSLRRGFGMTDRALYWKQHFQSAQRVAYSELDTVRAEGRPLKVNGRFFDANRRVNLRMLYLLRKIRREFR